MNGNAASHLIDLAWKREADALRSQWQARILAGRFVLEPNGVLRPRDLLGACILSLLAHNFDEALPVLLTLMYPGYRGLGTPMLMSAAKIAKTGAVMADVVTKTGDRVPRQQLFASERAMEKAFRDLGDRARLDDAERIALFDAVKRWVVCDFRLDPMMDSRDPDAKRLVN